MFIHLPHPVGILPKHSPWRSFMKFVDRSHVTSSNQRFFKFKILKTDNVHVGSENDWSGSFVLLYGWNKEDVRWAFSLFKSIGKLWAILSFMTSRENWASDLAKFYQDWGPDLCESRRRAHSPIGVSFECPYQHPPWSPVSIGKPAPKIHQWTIYFCRWGFGWVDKAQCFRSARRFGAAGSSPDFSRVFHDMALLGLCLELSFNVIFNLLSGSRCLY